MSETSSFRRLSDWSRPILGDGAGFLIGSHGLQLVLRMGSSLIITRLLSPEAYGVVGIISTVFYILQMMSDMGLRTYIVRHENPTDDLLRTVWTIKLIRNSVLFALMFLCAGPIALAFSAPEVETALRVCSFMFLIGGFSTLSMHLAARRRRINLLTSLEIASFFISIVVTIIAAYVLRTYWAIVIAMFVQAFFGLYVSFFIVKGPAVGFRWNREEFRDLWRFWRVIIPSSMISIIITRTDIIFMANYFPIAELGKFTIAATITAALGGLASAYTLRIFFPNFAEANRQAPEKALQAFYGPRRAITALFAFGIGGIIGGAELMVRILYNDLYLGAGLYVAILAVRPLIRLSTFPAEQAIIAKGFVRCTLTANIIRLAWLAVAGPAAFFLFSPIAVIIVISLAEAALIPFYFYMQKKRCIFKLSEEILPLAAALIGAAIGYGCYRFAEALIASGYLPTF
ncbi:MAG: oligosaccharide flippase family protein [Pseudomonadota bacterium]